MANAMKQPVSMEQFRQVRDQVKAEMKAEKGEKPKLEVIEGGLMEAEAQRDVAAAKELGETVARIESSDKQFADQIRAEVKSMVDVGTFNLGDLKNRVAAYENVQRQAIQEQVKQMVANERMYVPPITEAEERPTEFKISEASGEDRTVVDAATYVQTDEVSEPFGPIGDEKGAMADFPESTFVSEQSAVAPAESTFSLDNKTWSEKERAKAPVPVEVEWDETAPQGNEVTKKARQIDIKPTMPLGERATEIRPDVDVIDTPEEQAWFEAGDPSLKKVPLVPLSELPTAAPLPEVAFEDRPTAIQESEQETHDVYLQEKIDPINVAKIRTARDNMKAYGELLWKVAATKDFNKLDLQLNRPGLPEVQKAMLKQLVDAKNNKAENPNNLSIQEIADAWLQSYLEQGNEAVQALEAKNLSAEDKKALEPVLQTWYQASGEAPKVVPKAPSVEAAQKAA